MTMSFLARIMQNKLSLIGSIIVAFFFIIAALAPILTNYDPMEQNLEAVLQKPSGNHWCGTDELGRDILSRTIYGARTSMVIGLTVILISGGIGVLLGAISGYYGGLFDLLIMRIMETVMAFPTLLLALLIVVIIGTGLEGAIMSVSLASIPRFALQSRGSVLSVREKEYVEAAVVLGQGKFKILIKHILPNCLAPIIVLATMTLGNSILTVSGLGFLGVGAKPGDPEWGVMLSNARGFLRSAPHVAFIPGLAIALTVLGFNLLGDGLRDVFDVRQE
jgi:peptide/nickel transport system permease protein